MHGALIKPVSVSLVLYHLTLSGNFKSQKFGTGFLFQGFFFGGEGGIVGSLRDLGGLKMNFAPI